MNHVPKTMGGRIGRTWFFLFNNHFPIPGPVSSDSLRPFAKAGVSNQSYSLRHDLQIICGDSCLMTWSTQRRSSEHESQAPANETTRSSYDTCKRNSLPQISEIWTVNSEQCSAQICNVNKYLQTELPAATHLKVQRAHYPIALVCVASIDEC